MLKLALLFAAPLLAQPVPPCAGSPSPAYPETVGTPTVKVWNQSDWMPPACLGWTAGPGATLVATAGRFRLTGGAEELRKRIGAVSAMAGLLYWSTSNRKWQPLVIDAYAVAGPSGDQRRRDFTASEIAEGQVLYVHQEDNLLGKATYQIRIATATAGRLVFSTGNRSTIRVFGISVFQPGELLSVSYLERESNEVWRYYCLARIGKQMSLLPSGNDASLINRAVASYRYLAGIPADQEPPAAR